MGTHYIILLAFFMLNILKNKYVSLKYLKNPIINEIGLFKGTGYDLMDL